MIETKIEKEIEIGRESKRERMIEGCTHTTVISVLISSLQCWFAKHHPTFKPIVLITFQIQPAQQDNTENKSRILFVVVRFYKGLRFLSGCKSKHGRSRED